MTYTPEQLERLDAACGKAEVRALDAAIAKAEPPEEST